jgi:phosphohistidine phosphatase
MKTLLIVRHAKSSWKDMSLSDWERPLNKRGKRDAPMMGQRLADIGIRVDSIVSSTAVRAISTADIIADEIGFQKEIDQRDDLYHADERALLSTIRGFSDDLHAVMLVAHNPSITELVNELSGRWIDNVPTCGIAKFVYDVKSWKDVGRLAPMDFQFDYPKNT